MIATISPRQLQDLVAAGQSVELIDVRTPAEFEEVHVTFARNVPLDRLDAARLAGERRDASQSLYVICRSGSRSKQACEKFLSAGYPNIVSVEGGTQAWDQAGLPVVRGRKCFSLERQVRLLAGALVVVGAVVGAVIEPAWYGCAFAAAMGAGLMYAAITDRCPMAMVLAGMPWNQASRPGGSAADCGDTKGKTCCG